MGVHSEVGALSSERVRYIIYDGSIIKYIIQVKEDSVVTLTSLNERLTIIESLIRRVLTAKQGGSSTAYVSVPTQEADPTYIVRSPFTFNFFL